jgi:glutathione S-transferase
MLLTYVGAPFKSVVYDVHPKEGGGWDTSEWFSVKPALVEKNPFMNLPYVTDEGNNGLVLTQSNPCLTYLGRKFHLLGKDDLELAYVEQVIAQAFDLRNDAVQLWYNKSADENRQKMVDHYYQNHYKKFEGWLNLQGTKFTVGDSLTAGDFPLWEMLDAHELLAKNLSLPSPLESYPKLKEFHKNIREIPQLQAYFESDEYKLPVNQQFSHHPYSVSQ